MGDVVKLPDRAERVWNLLAKELRSVLLASGADAAKVAWLLEDLEPRYEAIRYEFCISLSHVLLAAVPYAKEAADDVAGVVETTARRALEQIVLLEMDLCAAKFGPLAWPCFPPGKAPAARW